MFRDNSDPVLFDNQAFENANVTVLHCREVLEKSGMTTEATRLQGLDITDRDMATVGLEILNAMRVKASAEYARQAAMESLKFALRS